MSRSFHNRLLRVNLPHGDIQVEEPGAVYLRRYMGGWNIIADALLREVPPGADPLGPENKLESLGPAEARVTTAWLSAVTIR